MSGKSKAIGRLCYKIYQDGSTKPLRCSSNGAAIALTWIIALLALGTAAIVFIVGRKSAEQSAEQMKMWNTIAFATATVIGVIVIAVAIYLSAKSIGKSKREKYLGQSYALQSLTQRKPLPQIPAARRAPPPPIARPKQLLGKQQPLPPTQYQQMPSPQVAREQYQPLRSLPTQKPTQYQPFQRFADYQPAPLL